MRVEGRDMGVGGGVGVPVAVGVRVGESSGMSVEVTKLTTGVGVSDGTVHFTDRKHKDIKITYKRGPIHVLFMLNLLYCPVIASLMYRDI